MAAPYSLTVTVETVPVTVVLASNGARVYTTNDQGKTLDADLWQVLTGTEQFATGNLLTFKDIIAVLDSIPA